MVHPADAPSNRGRRIAEGSAAALSPSRRLRTPPATAYRPEMPLPYFRICLRHAGIRQTSQMSPRDLYARQYHREIEVAAAKSRICLLILSFRLSIARLIACLSTRDYRNAQASIRPRAPILLPKADPLPFRARMRSRNRVPAPPRHRPSVCRSRHLRQGQRAFPHHILLPFAFLFGDKAQHITNPRHIPVERKRTMLKYSLFRRNCALPISLRPPTLIS